MFSKLETIDIRFMIARPWIVEYVRNNPHILAHANEINRIVIQLSQRKNQITLSELLEGQYLKIIRMYDYSILHDTWSGFMNLYVNKEIFISFLNSDYAIKQSKKIPSKSTFWNYISGRHDLMKLIEANIDKVNLRYLSINPAAYKFLIQNPSMICWETFCFQVKLEDISDEEDNLYWDSLSSNPYVIPFLAKNLDKVNWSNLSVNHAAIDLLNDNLEMVDDINVMWNKNLFKLKNINDIIIEWEDIYIDSRAMSFIKQYSIVDPTVLYNFTSSLYFDDYIRLYPKLLINDDTSMNVAVIDLLEIFQKRVHWKNLMLYNNCFTYDYYEIKQCKREIHNALYKYFFEKQ